MTWWRRIGEYVLVVVVALGVAVAVKTVLAQPFSIPSDSMERTLHGCDGCRGDRIVVDKLVYRLRDPRPGDVVVFHRPDAWPPDAQFTAQQASSNPVVAAGRFVGIVPPAEDDLVKRVVAVAGQTVRGDDGGRVQVGDHGAGGPFRTLTGAGYVYTGPPSTPQLAFGPVTVPAGRVWVMGDHRTDSADSRFHCAPGLQQEQVAGGSCDPTSSTVPSADIIGKAVVIAWPASRWATLGAPADFAQGEAREQLVLAVVVLVVVAALTGLTVVRRRRRRSRGARGARGAR